MIEAIESAPHHMRGYASQYDYETSLAAKDEKARQVAEAFEEYEFQKVLASMRKTSMTKERAVQIMRTLSCAMFNENMDGFEFVEIAADKVENSEQ
jgi:hypothetical protein